MLAYISWKGAHIFLIAQTINILSYALPIDISKKKKGTHGKSSMTSVYSTKYTYKHELFIEPIATKSMSY